MWGSWLKINVISFQLARNAAYLLPPTQSKQKKERKWSVPDNERDSPMLCFRRGQSCRSPDCWSDVVFKLRAGPLIWCAVLPTWRLPRRHVIGRRERRGSRPSPLALSTCWKGSEASAERWEMARESGRVRREKRIWGEIGKRIRKMVTVSQKADRRVWRHYVAASIEIWFAVCQKGFGDGQFGAWRRGDAPRVELTAGAKT